MKHAKSPNPDYNFHIGKDCTNFVSQCVYAGGVAMSKPVNPSLGMVDTDRYWYSIKELEYHGNGYFTRTYETSSWVGVAKFYDYSTRYGDAWVASVTSMEDLLDRVKAGYGVLRTFQ